MQQIVAADHAAMSAMAAVVIADLIAADPAAVVVPATGETPMATYRAVAAEVRRRGLDTARLRIFQLDEYLGLTPDDPRLLAGWMERSFLTPLAIPPANVTLLPSDAVDAEAACRAWSTALAASGGIDLAILGLGPNGHLGFNEPPVGPDAPTRVVDLAPASVHSNAAYWGDEARVPRRALTAGMAPLLAARRILLLVSGERKHGILRRSLVGPVAPEVPASFLQVALGEVTVVADRAAWGGLPMPGGLPSPAAAVR